MGRIIKHNGKISFWKFAFSLMIVALHLGFSYQDVTYRFSAGSIAVDFFFIVSGFLFCKKSLKIKFNKTFHENTFAFFINKIKRFLPYILFLWIIAIPYCILFLKYNLNDFIKAFYNLLYFPATKEVYDIFGITWYIVAMIIAQTILFPFLVKYKEKFVYFISPLIVLVLGGYLFMKYGEIAAPWSNDIFCYKGLIRAFVTLNIGMFLYILNVKLEKIKLTKFSKVLITIVEIFGYLSIFMLVNKSFAHERFDLLMLIILSICILISFSEKAYLNNFCKNKVFYYLEKLSLPIYLNQWLIIYMFANVDISYYCKLLLIIITLIILGSLEFMILDFFKKYTYKIKKIFVTC